MTFARTVLSVLKKIGWVLAAALYMVLVLFVQPIEWLLAVLFVLLALASCVSSVSVWAPIGCFAALLGVHLFVMFYPTAELDRRLGLSAPAGTRPPAPRPPPVRGTPRRRTRDGEHRRSLH